MINVMMYLGAYILAILAISLTVGLAWFLIVGRSLAKKNTVFDKELDAMAQRIKRRNDLNGRATDHEIDLNVVRRGGWTGPIPQSKNTPPKPPHNPHK